MRGTEAAARAASPLTLGYFAAAAQWGIDKLGAWPARIDTIVPRTSGGRSSGVFRRRTRTSVDAVVTPWQGHEITTAAQTAIDLARVSSFTAGVIAMDQALWARRPGGPLATRAEIAGILSTRGSRVGAARAWDAFEAATHLSDSVRESQSRVLIGALGFPVPVLQREFVLPGGRRIRTDFFFPDFDHAGEFDGLGKYLDPQMRDGQTAEQALTAEKDRGDELRRMVRALSRWRTPQLDDPRLLWDVLTLDGLPSRRPRPPAGLIFR
ncbi:hypothetical protein [Microbacterium sp. cx-59]|uniref:hypothetical protein n=1 Tax=Microbacterium sp. cx-59 TaxID=2891207 RepID=UPI001E62BE93|nr:hypothetical protein [Microbacterium sp. cx-59]MCC4909604.1 hypothetical protein [Microbacterium sp. cx-59]